MIDQLATLRQGAHNAVFTCMGVTAQDRVFILTDRKGATIGEALAEAARSCGAVVRMVQLEDYASRPIMAGPVGPHQGPLAFERAVPILAQLLKAEMA